MLARMKEAPVSDLENNCVGGERAVLVMGNNDDGPVAEDFRHESGYILPVGRVEL